NDCRSKPGERAVGPHRVSRRPNDSLFTRGLVGGRPDAGGELPLTTFGATQPAGMPRPENVSEFLMRDSRTLSATACAWSLHHVRERERPLVSELADPFVRGPVSV